MTNQEFDQLTIHFEEQVAKLSQSDQLLFLERIIAVIRNQSVISDEGDEIDTSLILSEEEVRELLTPDEPMTGKEMVEAGLIGGWEDKGIEDSVEWLKKQRAERRKKINW